MFKGRHFDRSVVLLCVRWYLAYGLRARTVAPSTILKKLAASPNPSQLAKALRELDRSELLVVHDRVVFQPGSAPAMPSRSQQG